MRVVLAAHGYPPELVGGTELQVRTLARGLAARGHEVVVVAGSVDHADGFRTSEAEDVDPGSGARVRVVRIHRADLFFDHWQKSASGRVAATFAALLRELSPDVVHVHHWIRLTRDLVAQAARAGVPAVVTLHDLFTTCLLAFRVRPDTHEPCDAPLGAHPCLPCAGQVPPRTPWVPPEALHLAFAERRADLARELALARAVVAPSRAHAERVAGYLGLADGALEPRVVPHGRDLDLAPRTPLAPPEELGRLVLGSWGHLHPLKGADLVVDAIARLDDPARVALHLAGEPSDPGFVERLDAAAAGLDVTRHGGYEAGALGAHPVTDVHAMVSGTRAPESWGLVLGEAVALGLPAVLPRTGAFLERVPEGAGALYYEPNDVGSLSAALARLAGEPGLVARLRAALPPLADVAPGVDAHLDATLAVYADALAAGPPEPPADEWWAARIRDENEAAWDAALARRTPEELGFEG